MIEGKLWTNLQEFDCWQNRAHTLLPRWHNLVAERSEKTLASINYLKSFHSRWVWYIKC